MSKKIGKNHYDQVDSTPVAAPLKWSRPPTLQETIRRILRTESMIRDLESQGLETFEEADDFDIPDDPVDPTTPWEIAADQAEQDSAGWEFDRDTRDLKKKVKVKKPKTEKTDPSASPEDGQA